MTDHVSTDPPLTCSQFDQQFQRLIDQRRSPTDDDRLVAHTRVCEDCQIQLQTWGYLEQHQPFERPQLAPRQLEFGNHSMRTSRFARAAALAAVVIVAIGTGYWNRSQVVTQSRLPTPTLAQRVTHHAVSAGRHHDSSQLLTAWWHGDSNRHWIETRAWIDDTLPAVESLRDGVVPIGRSFGRALTLLATGNGARHSTGAQTS